MRIIISGGGTGGHIFPAIAIANALKAADSSTDILFVGADGRMEMEKVPQAGYKIKGLWISGFQRRLTMDNLSFPVKVVHSMFKSWQILREFKPNVVVGVGGYASGAVLRVAQFMGIPTVIQEQNSYAGVTNKLLAKKAAKICTAYAECAQYFPPEKIVKTGNPVRSDITDITNKKTQAYAEYKIDPFKKTILVIGGSLGAKTINESINAAYDLWQTHEDDVQIIWQTGKNYLDDYLRQPIAKLPNVFPMAFISRMDLAYAAADVVISRAGALSISELCIVGKPAILIPSPNVAEDHQTKNAMSLVNVNAAILVKDAESQAILGKTVLDLLQNTALQNSLSANIRTLAKPNAAQEIAGVVASLIG
jgi:UDP-N-acetylglucosamine--N-acetylmuramyl-(pentapeptide) pyrophosphoryl-undecaprenol N-acetylglucosamine transferase